jgi:hypothetical protein
VPMMMPESDKARASMPIKKHYHEQIDRNHTYYRPDQATQERMERVRGLFMNLGHDLIDLCPPSKDLEQGLDLLETAQRCFIAALAKEG